MSNWQDIPAEPQPPQIPMASGERNNTWIDLPSANVRPAAIGAVNANPERTAQDYLLAERYKTAPSLVSAARSTFEERAAADDAANIMTSAPRLSGWYTRTPENAALAKDDLHNSADLERLLDSMRPGYLRGVTLPELVFPKAQPKVDGDTWDRTKRAWTEGQAGNRIATHGFLQIPLDGLSELFPSLFGDLAEANRDEIRGYREWIKNTPFTNAAGGAKVWEDFVRSSPQMATQISLGVLSGGIAVPTTFMGTQIAGSQYADLTEEGVNGGRAFLAALGNTAMQLPMEAIQMSKFMNIFKSSGLGQIARNVGEAALTSFVTETLQNYPDALTTLWAQSTQTGQNPMKQFVDNLGQYTLEGMYEGALSVPWALLGGSGRIAYDIGRYRTLNRDVEFFSALDDNAAASKMKARLPQAYQNLVDHLTASGPVQSLYIAPAAMRSAIQDESVLYQTANDMGISQEQFNRAEELGADIEVPLNLYQGKIAGTEVSLALRGEVRTSPEGMTLTEQTAFAENFRQQVESAVSEYRDSLLQDDELDNVLAPIEEELTSIYGKEGARANAALLRARANMAAQAWKDAGRDITPAQWLQDVAKLRVAVREQVQNEVGDLLHAAMIRATDATVADFAKRVATVGEAKKSFFEMTPGQGVFSDVSVRLPADTIRHRDKRHPDMTDADMNRLPQVLDSLNTENAALPKNDVPRFTGKGILGWAEVDGQTYGVVLESVRPDRAIVATYFKDSTAAVKAWFEQNADVKKAVTTPAALWPAQASKEDVLRNQPSTENIDAVDDAVNEGSQSEELHSDIRGSISFRDNETLISLFKDSADFSTFVHEIGHLFVKDMENLAATGQAPEQVLRDLESLKAFTAEFSNPDTLRGFYDSTFRKQRAEFAERDFSSLNDVERALVRNVAEQEKLADAFVTYINEGKAPSAELRPVFQRFRIWLQRLYQALSGQVAINEEIRGAFDRMLASEQDIRLAEQIHQAQAAEMEALDTVAAQMLTEQEQANLLKARQTAAATSREQRLKKVLRAYYRAGANRSEIRKQAADTVNAMPVYAAQDQAITEGGISYEEVREAYGAEVANALLKKRPGLLRKEGTVPLHDLAVAHGFATEEELLDAIRNAPGKKAETNALVQSEIAAREEAILQELGLDDSANSGDLDYYSDQRLEALELEARALSRASGEHGRRGRTFGTAETLRTLARRMLESMPYRETANVGRLSAAEAKQAARAAQVAATGDMDTAADAKRRQAINHAMVLEALQYRHEAEAFTRALKRYAKSERMVFEYQEQIRAMAQRYKLAPGISPRNPDERASLRDFIDSATADSVFEAPPFSDFILSERVPENMTLGEMREIRDVVRWLAAEGNPEEARLLSEGIDGTVSDTVKTGVAALQASGNTFTPKTEGTLKRTGQDKWQGLFAGLDHIKFMMMSADGYKEIGKNSHLAGFHSQWFQRVMDAQSKFLSMFRSARPELDRIALIRDRYMKRFEQQYGKWAEEINGVRTPEVMREVGRTHWTAEHIWCLARNMGNAGNLKTLHQGLSLTDADLRALTAALGRDEWLAIQAEGDLLGKHFAESDKVFRQIYGRPMPGKVEPLPLTVQTAEGDVLDLPGWYFPIAIDGRLNPEIGDKQEIDLAKTSPDFVAYGPSMAKSFTKSRTGTGRAVVTLPPESMPLKS